jgi:replicative DNA helicase
MYTEKNDIKTYISYTLLPALYERLEHEGVLDEFKFKYKKTRAVSTTSHRYTGRIGKSIGQVVIYEANPGYLIDNSEAEKSLDIISYIQHVKHGEDIGFIKALDELATMAGVKPYRRTLTEEEKIALEKESRRAKVWQSAVNFCIQCIQDPQYKEEARPIVDYLTKARSYTIDDVVAMQLGYLPGQGKLNEYLQAQGFSKEEIKDTIQLPAQAGSTNRLTIPIKNRNGRPVGLAIRNANYTGVGAKYVYNTGLTKSEALFNLYSKAKNKKVVLVEGQLDAAIAEARGFTLATVAALGGKTISTKQIDHLVAAGAEKIFICLDNEEETKPQTKAIINELIKVEELAQNIYIAQLPDDIKDVDELITKQGLEALEEAIRKATAYYVYLSEDKVNEYSERLKADDGILTDLNRNQLIEDIERVAATISSPTRRDDLKNTFTRLLAETGVEISAEAFIAAVDRIRYKDDQAKQSIEINKTLKAAQKHNDEGRQSEALKELDNVRQLKLIDKITEYKALDEIDHSEEALIKIINDKPEAVDTGYTVNIDGEITPIKIEASQLTFIAAATGHGKTSFLINTALNIIKADTKKVVYLFTYEMPADEILLLALNTFVGISLNKGNNNRRTIKQYYRGKDFLSNDTRKIFIERKKEFYKDIVPRLKIRQTDYSADELIQFIHYVRKQNEDAVIFIDYIQKLRSDKKGSITARHTELKFVCEDLNQAAIESGLPIALGAQFNRDVQAPIDMQPTSLSEASDIEKIASEIYALWNCTKPIRKVDNKDAATIEKEYNIKPGVKEDAIILEVIKSRSIGTGHKVKLGWHGNSGKITQEALIKVENMFIED